MSKQRPQKSKIYVCQVQNCPGENPFAPPDEKFGFKDTIRKVFGDHSEVVDCKEVLNDSKRRLFCEMLIKSDQTPAKKKLPKSIRIVAETVNESV